MSGTGFWQDVARKLVWKWNVGLWLERSLPTWTGVSFLSACIALLLRSRGAEVHVSLWVAFGAVLVVVGIAQGVRSRSEFFTLESALAWLDGELRLHNRLSSAYVGVGRWPSSRSFDRTLLKWHWLRVIPPPLFSAVFLMLAMSVPVTLPEPPRPLAAAKPVAWEEMESWLEEMKDESVIRKEAIETWEQKLRALQDQPREEWFEHSSLEATDSLRDELASELGSLEREIEDFTSSLEELSGLGRGSRLGERRLAKRRLEKTVDALELGTLPLKREVVRELHVLARERDIRPLTKEEIERLQERLYHGLPKSGELAAARTAGAAGVEGSGRPGRGGITRGPGSAPIHLSDERTELGTSHIENVSNRDLRHASLGQTLGVSVGEHEDHDGDFRGGLNAGAVSSMGEGGDLAWRQSLTPREQEILRRFFK